MYVCIYIFFFLNVVPYISGFVTCMLCSTFDDPLNMMVDIYFYLFLNGTEDESQSKALPLFARAMSTISGSPKIDCKSNVANPPTLPNFSPKRSVFGVFFTGTNFTRLGDTGG